VRFPKDEFIGTLREVIKVSVGVNKDVLYLEKLDSAVGNSMFRDGLALVGMGFKADDIRKLMEIKKAQNEAALAQCSVMFFNMAKMGPAFGLLGTLVGLIILLYYHMGEGNMEKIASSMGVALSATLYGVGLANLIFQPLAEYMQYNAERGAALDDMVIEGTVQIRERRHPIYLVQTLKAYMPREEYDAIERVMREEMAAAGGKAPDASRDKAVA
jgi:chemotaxis protein MotA